MLVTKSRLIEDLGRLGVVAGQVVMLHVSVKALGWVVGGPDIVLQAVRETLGSTGTLLMLLDWEDNPYELPTWSAERQQAYLEECPTFDPLTSRANREDMSILAEYFRTLPGTQRSNRPSGSIGANGALATWLVADHAWNYGWGPGSPLAKLCEAGGQALMLGAPLNTVTLLHHAEHLAKIANKKIARYSMPIIENGQKIWKAVEEFETSEGIVDWPGDEDYFELIVRDFLASGQGKQGQVGAASSLLLDATALCNFGIKWMEEKFSQLPGHSLMA